MYEYNAKIINVVDGDTFDLDVDLGFHIHHHVRVRLLDIDTPETRGEEKELGLLCKKYAEQFLGKDVFIRSYKDDTDVKTDSFGRWLVKLGFNNCPDTTYRYINEVYNNLGVNKLNENYSENNVLALKGFIENDLQRQS